MKPYVKKFTNYKNSFNDESISKRSFNISQLKNEKNENSSLHENVYYSKYKDTPNLGSSKHSHNLNNTKDINSLKNTNSKNYIDNSDKKNDIYDLESKNDLNNLKSKNYMIILKNNTNKNITNTNKRKSIFEEKKGNILNNNIKRKYIENNKKKINENNNVEHINLEKNINLKCINSNNKFIELKSLASNSKKIENLKSTISDHIENFPRIKKVLSKLKNNDKESKFKSISISKTLTDKKDKKEPINENISNTNKKDSILIEKNKTKNETAYYENRKTISRISLIKNSKINQICTEIKQNNISDNILKNKRDENINSAIDDTKKNILNMKVKEINKPSLLCINKNEKNINKFNGFSPKYLSKYKSSIQKKTTNSLSNEKFHQNLKKILINTIINPQKEKNISDQLFPKNSYDTIKKADASLNKSILCYKENLKNAIKSDLSKNSINIKEKIPLTKNTNNSDVKQKLIRRFSTIVDSQRFTFKKNNLTKRFSIWGNEKNNLANNENKLIHDKYKLTYDKNKLECEKSIQLKKIEIYNYKNFPSNINNKNNYKSNILYKQINNIEEKKNILRKSEPVKVKQLTLLNKRNITLESINKENKINKSKDVEKKNEVFSSTLKKLNTLNLPIKKINVSNINKECTFLNRDLKTNAYKNFNQSKKNINIKLNKETNENLKKNDILDHRVVIKNNLSISNNSLINEKNDTLKNDTYIQSNSNNENLKLRDNLKLNGNIIDENYLKINDQTLEKENKKHNENKDYYSPKINSSQDNFLKTCFYEDKLSRKEEIQDNSKLLLKNTLSKANDNIKSIPSLNNKSEKLSNLNFNDCNSNMNYFSDVSSYKKTKHLSFIGIKESNDNSKKKKIGKKFILDDNRNNSEDNFNDENNFLLKEKKKKFIKQLNFDEASWNNKECNNNNVKEKVNIQFKDEKISPNKKIINILDDKRMNENSEYNEKVENIFTYSKEKIYKQVNIRKNSFKLSINNKILHNDKLKEKTNDKIDLILKKNVELKNNKISKYNHNVVIEQKADEIFHKNENVENDNKEILCYKNNNSKNRNDLISYIDNDEKKDEHKLIKENREKIKEDIDIKGYISKNIYNDKIKLQNNSNKTCDIAQEMEEQQILINSRNKKNKHDEDNILSLNSVSLNNLILSDSYIEYSNVIYHKKEKSHMFNESEYIKKNENCLNKRKVLRKLNYENWRSLKEKKNKYLRFKRLNKNNNGIKKVKQDRLIKKSKSLMKSDNYKKRKKYEYDRSVEKNEEKKKINQIENNNKLETSQNKEEEHKENIILENENHIKNDRYLNSNKISKKFLLNKFMNNEKQQNAKYNFYLKFKKNYNLSLNNLNKKILKKRKLNKIYENIFHLKDKENNIDNNFQVIDINFSKKHEEKKKVKKKKIENSLNITSNYLKKKKKKKLNYPLGYGIEGDIKMNYLKNYKTRERKKKKLLKNDNIFNNETQDYKEKKNNIVNIEYQKYEKKKKVKIIEECEQLEKYLEKNKNIFFYEHEWISIIFQVINDDKFYLAERLMTLIFEKEEELYKWFVDNKKKSKEKNNSDYNENCVNINDINENSTDKNNINKNINKKNRKLSDFMQQIVDNCPEEWPLLDIGILIIVSQIVCFIFSFNKWNFFCESCRVFEKHCVGILLNSSIINFKKNNNTILMFEHEFFYKIIIPKNYKPSKNIIKYHSNYLKNDYLVKEKTILDIIFLALAYYITISHNLNEYIEKNNIICYLNLFHKNFDKKKEIRDEENKKKKKTKKSKSPTNKWNSIYTKNIKHRFSEDLHKNKSKKYNHDKKERRKTYFERNLRKRLSILRTTKCINKRENNQKNTHLKKIYTNKEDKIINENSEVTNDDIENELTNNNEKGDKISKRKNSRVSNYVNNFVLFKNNNIDTIVKYQTKTNFEKLLCLIIIEIFNLIYDSREYSIENILIIRKFFRVFLNITQKKFISLSIDLHLKKNYKDENDESIKKKDSEDYKKNENENYDKKNYKNANGEKVNDDKKLNNIIPLPNHIYDNYNNIWAWIERIFSENFYEINNMLYNLCCSKKNNAENNEININYEKIELISQNIKRFSSLQKHNCLILKNYWIIFGLKEKISNECLASNSLLPHSYFPNIFLHNENILKNNIFFKLEKKDLLYDTLTLYFLSWIECIYKVFLSIEEIPSFLHLQNKKYLTNDIINKNEDTLQVFNISLKNNDSNKSIPTCKDYDNNKCYKQNEREKIEFLLKQIKKKLKIYDIQWHEQYEKKYLDLLICMKMMKKKFKQKKLFRKIMKYNISSIWLNKSQVYLQYIQITINCKFFLGSSYHEIYLFIKKNYELVIHMIENKVDEKKIHDGYVEEKEKKIYIEDENNCTYENENMISENILLMAWEIANFYFSILYFKLELKSILIEMLKWIKIFEKDGEKFFDFFKFRCVSYILHILIFTNKYKYAQKIIKHISHDYFNCNYLKKESKIILINDDNNNRIYNKIVDAKDDFIENTTINIKKCFNNNITNELNNGYTRRSFSNYEKKELHSHILNKCYLYDKWINFKMKKYNNLIIYLLKKKNIVKLILFNNKNLNVLMKRKKEKKLIRHVSIKMAKLQDILLSIYYLCIKLYKSYYYHSSILHYNTSQQILAASKYLNIVIKKKEIIMNYFPLSFQNSKYVKKKNSINDSNSFIESQNLLSLDGVFNDNLNLLNISSLNNEENNNYFFEYNKECIKLNIEDKINNNENNDLFYLHALILSIQIQYTLSISIIICSDLFNFSRKLKRLKKIKKRNRNIQKDNYKKLTFISSIFNYKILCKHYRIMNIHDINGKKEKMKRKKKKKKKNNSNNLDNGINNDNLDITYPEKNLNNNFIFNETRNNTSKMYNNDIALSQKNKKLTKFTNISLNDFNSILNKENNRNYNSDIITSTKNNYQELIDKSPLSDSILDNYRNYKQYTLKKEKKNNHFNKLKIKKKNDININNNFHILIKISTWLSKNSASQLIWIAQKLFKMYLPELLCVILALQANMFKNKNILTNIKRIDRILKLCSENPQLVYFATESLKSYKNRKNLKKYKNYFKLNEKYKEIFLNKKKDINNSKDILYKVCDYFFN
ncbi:conserved Plasmodium protein, unknown function [Plasmodium relictum]|uniref:Uncharacterized protein n=1 Tax=Plasmodium relictum TaxID=85471 RepID=A0A1J1H8S4_PLARL|nr:conserved Plasmodium protein, unknown function [Plasmodium relictum]CRH00943.1 conserved Plasmodium protein, unknown function [Plasmodium relictum]